MPEHDGTARYLRRQHPTDVTGFTWDFTGDSLTVHGDCPRCQGETGYQPPVEVQVGATKGPGGPAKAARKGGEKTYMTCRCPFPHPQDTQEKGGCGLSWVAVRPPESGTS